MGQILVDSNIILDIVTEDPKWYSWSAVQLESLAEEHMLIINPIIYSEVSIGFDRIEDLDQALPPEFYIGAHAAIRNMALVTRDPQRYKTYFPKLRLISP